MISFLIALIAAINFLNHILMHTIMYRHSLHELHKMAELVEMQCGMLSWVGPGNMYYMGVDAAAGRDTFWACGRLKSIVKCRILGVG